MTELLELAKLQNRYHMTYMEDSSRWIDTEFNAKLFSGIEFFLESFLIDDLRNSFGEEILEGRMR